jgi:hypothetical protein
VEPCQHQQSLPRERWLHLPIRQLGLFGCPDKQRLNFNRTLICYLPNPNPRPPFQVAAEVYGATMNRNPPSEIRVSSNHGRPGYSSSVASSRQRQVQEEQNQINQRAREEQALIDEEEQNLEEQEAADSAKLVRDSANLEANNAILEAKARSRGARVRQELDNRRFEVGAARSESLAHIEDEIANDMGSAHGLDAVSVNNWVNGTNENVGPESDNTTPFVTNPSTSQPASGPDFTDVTEPVRTNVDPCTRPFDTTMLPNPGNLGSDHNVLRQHLQQTSSINI